MIVASFKIDKDLKRKAEEVASKMERTFGYVVRAAIEEYLEKFQKEIKDETDRM